MKSNNIEQEMNEKLESVENQVQHVEKKNIKQDVQNRIDDFNKGRQAGKLGPYKVFMQNGNRRDVQFNEQFVFGRDQYFLTETGQLINITRTNKTGRRKITEQFS